jgi:excisionase family DNA binding protein
MTTGTKTLLSVPEGMQQLGISKTMIFKLIKSGELESVKIGSRRLIPSGAVTAFAQRLREQQNGAAV